MDTEHRQDPHPPEATKGTTVVTATVGLPDKRFFEEYVVGDKLDPLQYRRINHKGRSNQNPPDDNITFANANKQIDRLASSIKADHNCLKLILERHEATLHRRWKKRNRIQKLRILDKSWDGPMNPNHCADFDAFWKWKQSATTDSKQHDACMWPYINHEDLVEPCTLLVLLRDRGYVDPAQFANPDLDAMHLGLMTGILKPIYLSKSLVAVGNCKALCPYATLLHWDDDCDMDYKLQDGGFYLPGQGLLILEAQERLMSFLVKCARELLLDIPEESLIDGPIQPENNPIWEQYSNFSSKFTLLSKTSYRVSHRHENVDLVSLLTAKADEAVDHLVSLRDDPAYFSQHMKEVFQHQRFMVPHSQGRLHSVTALKRCNYWGLVLSKEIISAAYTIEVWTFLSIEAFKMQKVQLLIDKATRSSRQQTQNYKNLLLRFRYWLARLCEVFMLKFQDAIAASPSWRSYHETVVTTSERGEYLALRNSDTWVANKEKRELLFLLQLFFPDRAYLLAWFGPGTAMDELRHLLDASSTARATLTPYASSLLSDLFIAISCLHQTDTYQPWRRSFGLDPTNWKDTIEQKFKSRIETPCDLALELGMKTRFRVGQYSPDKTDFRYPVNKRRTEGTVRMLRTAEANLEKFWRAVKESGLLNPILKSYMFACPILLAPSSIPRTPEWTKTIRPKAVKADSDVQETGQVLSETYFDLQQRTESTLSTEAHNVSTTRSKVKSRGMANSDRHDTSTEPAIPKPIAEPQEYTSQQFLQVNARALKVFKTLFFSESPTATPGEVAWNDFLHAMTSLDFQVKKLHGSMWQFAPTKGDMQRNIIFHEPHPTGKIPYHTARRHGRRLKKVYGWEGSMFILASKAEKTQPQNTV